MVGLTFPRSAREPQIRGASGQRGVIRAPEKRLPTHDDIAARAYEVWERTGRPDGRDQEIWLQAEHELLEQATASEEQEA